MESLYLAILSEENDLIKLDKEQYGYNELQLWLPKFANMFQNVKIGKDALVATLDHLTECVIFSQMSKSVVKAFLVSLGSLFTREHEELTDEERVKLAEFISKLIQSRDIDSMDDQFDNIASLENLAYWACQNVMEPKFSVTIASFLACYSHLGSSAIMFLQKTRRYLLTVFEAEKRDKECAQVQLDILRLMWNLSQVSSPEQTAILAEKFFKTKEDREDNLGLVFKLCKNELSSNPGGLSGLISASILIQNVTAKIPDAVYRFENDNKNRGNMISSCIKALRDEEDFDSARKAIIAQLLHKMAELSPTISEIIVRALSEDEDEFGDSLILNLIAKDPIKHGNLPNWAAELFINLELGDVGNYPQRADLQNVLTEQLYQVKESLSQTNHLNITLVHNKLMILTKMTKEVTCPKNTSTQSSSSLTDCIREVLDALAAEKSPSEAMCWSFCTLHEWLPSSEVSKLQESKEYIIRLRYAIGALLRSESIQIRRYGLMIARVIPEDIIPTDDFFLKIPVLCRAKRPLKTEITDDEDKENVPQRKIANRQDRSIKDEPASQTIRKLLIQREEELLQIEMMYTKERELRTTLEEKISLDGSNRKFDSTTILSLTSEINVWKDNVENLESEVHEQKEKISLHKQELKDYKVRCDKHLQEANSIQKSKELVISELNKVKSELKREKQHRKVAEEENASTMSILGKLINKHNSTS